jgi:hypothetical protein
LDLLGKTRDIGFGGKGFDAEQFGKLFHNAECILANGAR